MAKKLITIIIPAYNEEEALPKCLQRITKLIDKQTSHDFEVLLVDDGSKDKTVEIIKKKRQEDKRFSYVAFSRNFGKEIAIMAGLDYAKGDAVIFIDADLQDPPEVIPELIKYWEQGYDDVYAKRRSRKGESWLKKWTSKMYYRVLQKMSSVEIQKDTGDFRLLDRRCVNALKQMRETSRNSKSMSVDFPAPFSPINACISPSLRVKSTPCKARTPGKLLLILCSSKTAFSFTTSPLKVATYIAIPTTIMFIGYFIYAIVKAIITQIPVQAYQAIILLILFFAAVNIMLFGIVGEYLGRIFKESKSRPLYFVDEYNGKKETNEKESK